MKKILATLLAAAALFCFVPFFSTEAQAAFSGADKINIVLDPGHGGANVGASARGIGEKTYTMKLATLMKSELESNGSFNVYLTRTGDYDLELYQRAEVANSYNADILISLHFDGNPSPSVHGVTAYTSVIDSCNASTLAQSITSNISSSLGLANNGVRRRNDNAGYYWNYDRQWDCQDPSLGKLSDYYGIPTWCAKFGIRSIIVEHGYFSNAGDVSKVCAEGAIEKLARAEAKAIIDYYTNHTHVYSASTRDFPSNCIYTGKQSEHCSYCGHRRNVTSLAPAPDNHYWVNKESTPASCGVDGKTVRECRITQNLADKGWQGALHTDTVITPAPTQHTYEMTAHVEPTHTVDGYKEWKCKTCKSSFKDIIKAEGHSFEFVGYAAPTCTKSGGNTYKCTKCSHQYTETEPATGHSFTVIKTVEPTCTKDGSADKKCTVCSHEQTDILPAPGHSLPEGAVVPATCTTDGYRKGTCLRCSESIDEITKSTGHTFSVTKTTPATCEESGEEISTCTVCAHEESTTLEPLGHSYEVTDSKKATCEKAGHEELRCTVCSHSTQRLLDPLGHEKAAEGTVTKKATPFSTGAAEYPCKNGCGKIFTEKIAPTLSTKIKIIIITAGSLICAGSIVAIILILFRKTKSTKKEPLEEPSTVPSEEGTTEEKTFSDHEDRTEGSEDVTERETKTVNDSIF